MIHTPRPIPRDLQDRVQNELESGERIEWMEMPIPRFFTGASTSAFLFGIPWTAFALFWTYMASGGLSSGKGSMIFAMFGIPFILIGFAMLSSPVWAYRKSFRTVYVITDRRAITFDGGRSTTIRSYTPENLKNVYRREKRDGSGDVIFGVNEWKDSDGDRRSLEIGFLRIGNPKAIEQSLRKLAEKAKP